MVWRLYRFVFFTDMTKIKPKRTDFCMRFNHVLSIKKRTSWVFLFTQSLHNLLFSLHFWSRWLHSVPCPQLHRCRPSDIPPAPLRSPEHLWPVATHKTHKENTHLEHKDTTLMAITVTDCSYCYHDHLIWKLLFILIDWLFILHKIYEDKDFFFFFFCNLSLIIECLCILKR